MRFALWMLLMVVVGANQPCPANAQRNIGDAQFARIAFTALANGDLAAQKYIDWEHLQAVGTDVGKQYRSQPSGSARAEFRKGFIKAFSRSFKQKGATAESLKNWRVKSRTRSSKVIAADAPSKAVLLLTITVIKSSRKISKMEIN